MTVRVFIVTLCFLQQPFIFHYFNERPRDSERLLLTGWVGSQALVRRYSSGGALRVMNRDHRLFKMRRPF